MGNCNVSPIIWDHITEYIEKRKDFSVFLNPTIPLNNHADGQYNDLDIDKRKKAGFIVLALRPNENGKYDYGNALACLLHEVGHHIQHHKQGKNLRVIQEELDDLIIERIKPIEGRLTLLKQKYPECNNENKKKIQDLQKQLEQECKKVRPKKDNFIKLEKDAWRKGWKFLKEAVSDESSITLNTDLFKNKYKEIRKSCLQTYLDQYKQI